MIDLTGVTHHPAIAETVEVLCNKTQNTDRGFFRAEMAFFICKMAANMRAKVITKDRGEIPVNMYTLALATSGFGKGHSVHIIEDSFMGGFKRRFMDDTFNVIAEKSLWDIANKRAARDATDQQEEFDKAMREFRSAGSFPFTFDSGTPPAVKQLRHKLLLANAGAINLQIDEIGSNLIGSVDVLNLFLELFDQGIVKQKLIKNTAENIRGEELDGKTPTNMLLFGTPSKLLDGGQTEDQFYSFLETGYARRCLFGIGQQERKAFNHQSPSEIFAALTKVDNAKSVTKWNTAFHRLADPAMFDWEMEVKDPVAIQLLTYKIACEQAAEKMSDHEEIRKAELSHRYFKALKLAGAYAFVDESTEVEMDHLMSAILLVEESGEAFQSILNREKTYVKLAKYMASIGSEMTHADLHEGLPFYKTGNAARNEMMSMAMAWGYKHHIVIKKSFIDGIEFFTGETLKETNLDEMIVSYGEHYAYNYNSETAPFDQLHLLTQEPNLHWVNHHLKGGHRTEENVISGFNMIGIDFDGSASLEAVHDLLSDYKFMTHTTKRHTPEENRFRLIIPINYHLELESSDYKEFMNTFMEWLPFPSDEGANQRARKWETFEGGTYHYNMEGAVMDALQFIPKTSKNEAYKNEIKSLESLDNLERWFAQRIASGNRNNQMIKFALALVDSGMDLIAVGRQVHDFNKKLNSPLTDEELENTIMVTVSKRYQKAA